MTDLKINWKNMLQRYTLVLTWDQWELTVVRRRPSCRGAVAPAYMGVDTNMEWQDWLITYPRPNAPDVVMSIPTYIGTILAEVGNTHACRVWVNVIRTTATLIFAEVCLPVPKKGHDLNLIRRRCPGPSTNIRTKIKPYRSQSFRP